jgi:hypothetical protein
MTAKAPSSARVRVRGRFRIAPRACRSKHASTARSASAGETSFSMCASVR